MKKFLVGATIAIALGAGTVAPAEAKPGCNFGQFVSEVAHLDGPMGKMYKPGQASHGANGFCAGQVGG